MKHRLLSLAAIILFLACLGTSLFHPAQAQAASRREAANSYCNSEYNPPTASPGGQSSNGSGAAVDTCVRGFLAALKDNAPAPPSNNSFDRDGYCYTNLYPNNNSSAQICQTGYIHAYSQRDNLRDQNQQTPDESLDDEAYAQCVENGEIPDGVSNRQTLLSNCVTGYTAAKKGKTQDEACQSIPGSVTNNAGVAACQNGYELATAQNDSDDGPPTCESSGVELSWIFCPVINGLAEAVDDIYSGIIQPLLETKPLDLASPADDPQHIFDIWSNFRVYGNIFLVIALLAIVFGESISGGLIDAYTAKKVLPRLLIAAVLINISIYIVAFAVDITNIVGNGVAALIQAPFQDAGAFKLQLNESTSGIGLAALVGGGIWAVASAAVLLEFLLVVFLIPAFLTFFAILVTVLLRQGLIIFLILVAPIAFALFCLPNTEQYFRKWWDLLFKTLLIYPIIAVSFALANVLSVTIGAATSGLTKTFADFVSIIALFVPLFIIPYSFRIAGGLLGRVHDIATDVRNRAHEGIVGSKNSPNSWRNQSRTKLAQKIGEQGLTGRALVNSAIPPQNPLTKAGRERWRYQREARKEATRYRLGGQYAEGDEVFQRNKGDDNYLLAMANPTMAQKKRDAAKDPTERARWDMALANARITHRSPAVRQQALHALAGTGFQFASGQQGYNELAETVASITGVDEGDLDRDDNGNITGVLPRAGAKAGAYATNMDEAQYRMKGGGRFDLAGINHGTGYAYASGIDKSSGYTAGQGKPDTYKAGAEHYLGADLRAGSTDLSSSANLSARLAQNLSSGGASPDQVATWHSKLLDAQMGATGANKNEIDKQLQAIEGIANSTPSSDKDLDTWIRLKGQVDNNKRARRSTIEPDLLDDNK